MPRKVEKKAFLFYASTFETLELFPLDRQKKIAMTLIEYGLSDYSDFGESSEILLNLLPQERIVFRSTIYEIDVRKRRYRNKQLIRGAIETIQNEISHSPDLNQNRKDDYIEVIGVLQEKYQEVLKHDGRSVPEEICALLPVEIYQTFRRRYEIKFWKDYVCEELEARLMNMDRQITDDSKQKILEELLLDYVKTGTAFTRFQELLDKYDASLESNNSI